MKKLLLLLLLAGCGEPCHTTTYVDYAPTIQALDPCGRNPYIYNEVIYRYSNGVVVDMYNRRIFPGRYITTDGDRCVFTIGANGYILWESHRY